MEVTYRKAMIHDIPAMQQLVRPEIESGVILMRTDNEVATNIRSYQLAFDGQRLIGFAALHLHTPTLGETRSLIVAEPYRGMHVGTGLIIRCLEEAAALGLKEVLALTYSRSFFERLGFVEISKESLPEHKIWADCIKCKHFPVCNEIALIKQLS